MEGEKKRREKEGQTHLRAMETIYSWNPKNCQIHHGT